MQVKKRYKGLIVAMAVVLVLGIAGLIGVAGCGDKEGFSSDSAVSTTVGSWGGPPTTMVVWDEGSEPSGAPVKTGVDQALSGTLGALRAGTDQKIITTAQLDIEVEKGTFQSVFNQALLLADRYGGYVVSSSSQASGEEDSMKSGLVTVRVPVGSFSNALTEANKLGEVKNQYITTEDVTEEYVDLKARITNSEAHVRQLLELLTKARTVDEILQVQAVLSSAQADLEQLKGRQRYLDEHTSYSTLSLSIYEAGVEVEPQGEWGFVNAFKDALHNFVDAISQVVRGLGWLIPILVIVAIIVFLLYLLWRRVARRNRRREQERYQWYQQHGWPAQPGPGTQTGAAGQSVAPAGQGDPGETK